MKKVKSVKPAKAQENVNALKAMTYEVLKSEFIRIAKGDVGPGFNAGCRDGVLNAIKAEAASRKEFKSKEFDEKILTPATKDQVASVVTG